ncbi:MAG: PBP1A family penicillin-binding protein [Hyphomicrobiaceae bacterium]|nr:PBP1A family penicillin-binding protein [Hyphomicrobiaceae bacterium]
MGLFDESDKHAAAPIKPRPHDRDTPSLGLSWGTGPVANWMTGSQPRSNEASTTYKPSTPIKMAGIRQRLINKRIPRTLIALPLAAFGIALLLLGIAMIVTTIAVPNPMALRKDEPTPTIRILAADGSLLIERGQPYDYIPVDLLPQHTVNAIVATEDHRFFLHWGLDPWGLFRAAFANLRAGRYAQGGSTLTQQLAKNLFLSSERRLSRKIEELYLALWLELRLSKADILELYINRVYFGGGAYGIEAAAQRYFGKSARNLNLTESAVLAGLLKAPSKFSPLSSPTLARNRAKTVINRMHLAGYLSAVEETAAIATEITFTDVNPTREITGIEFAIDHVLERLPTLQGSHAKAIIVETTIDATLQRSAQRTVSAIVTTEADVSQASQASMILMEPTGAIVALVGGANYSDSQFNRAIKAKRQPGSTFKPFVYLTSLEAGMRPDSAVYDLPITINGYSPRNDDGSFKGAMTMRQALANSVNSVAVRLMLDAGIKKTVATANRLGIKSELREGPSLALGTSEVTLVELTSAYGVLASGGLALEPHVIRSVKTSSGEILYQRPIDIRKQVVKPDDVGAMNDMLNATLVSGTGRRAAIARHPAAGKTGTSQDFRDAWFIGYTAHYVAGVWFGNDNGRPMNRIVGGNLPARVWRDVMIPAHSNRTPKSLPGTETAQLPRDSKDGVSHTENDPIAHLMKADQTPFKSNHPIHNDRNNPVAMNPSVERLAAPSKTSQDKQIDKNFLGKVLGGLPATSGPIVTEAAMVTANETIKPRVNAQVTQEQAPQARAGFNPRALREALGQSPTDDSIGETQRLPKIQQPPGMMGLGLPR